jgi:uncharacterized membrane protein YphA (DoxX/SURF4 family)
MSDLFDSPALTTLAVLLAAFFALAGSTKVLAVPSMRDRAAHVGFTVGAYRRIGVLEVLGAAGVLIGLGIPELGALAGAGLLVLMLGALIVHSRSGDKFVEVVPALGAGVVALAYVVLAVGQL